MTQRFAHRILLVVIALSTLASGSAWAGWYSSDPRDDGLPASVRRIQRETGGEVLKAQPLERDGREVYRVKVLTPQGRIRVYEDDPRGEPPPAFSPREVPAPAYPRQGPAPAYPRQGPRQFSPPRNHHPA
ncbi:MAG TPA: hypothetical protein VK753_11020 [Xanthomonadaceae bacterium]|nr:hypothetical protein [Xanthomonadaceae bacterium]